MGNITVEKFTGNELIVREGDALPLLQPNAIIISGDIKSISNFLKVRTSAGAGSQVVDNKKAIVTVNKDKRTIALELDPEYSLGTIVNARLELTPELNRFKINYDYFFKKDELVKLIKFNKLYFESKEKHAELVTAFSKLSSTVNISARDSNDDRGNKEREYVKSVETNAPTDFILNIPIFKGFEPIPFRVNICLDVIDGVARFWLESVELHEKIQVLTEEIFTKELESVKGFVVINE